MSTTTRQRKAWAPACTPKGQALHGAYAAIDAVFRRWNYQVGPNTWTFACRQITAGKDYSLHAYGPGDQFTFWTGVTRPTAVALDVNSDRNPYSGKGANRLITDMPAGMIAEIEAIHTVSGEQVWEWGGRYKSIKDPMHFDMAASPAGLLTGIAGQNAPAWKPPAFPGVVKKTSSPERVAAWRMLLAACGYRGFRVGVYPWSVTLGAATRRFQRNHGLVVDGIVGPKTWAVACQVLRKKRAKEKG